MYACLQSGPDVGLAVSSCRPLASISHNAFSGEVHGASLPHRCLKTHASLLGVLTHTNALGVARGDPGQKMSRAILWTRLASNTAQGIRALLPVALLALVRALI